jgi:hypothetical protein
VTLRGEVFMLKHTEAQGFWKEYMRLYYPDGFTDDFTVCKSALCFFEAWV